MGQNGSHGQVFERVQRLRRTSHHDPGGDNCHESEGVCEWLPYTRDEKVPKGEAERWEWLKGMDITVDATDEEVMAAKRGYLVKYAKVAARFRKELIEKYGTERGSKVRFAEAFEISEYGRSMNDEMKRELFSL